MIPALITKNQLSWRAILLSLLLLSSCSVPLAYSLTSDKSKPLHVHAGSAQVNRKTGLSVYQDDVKMTQGTTTLSGNTIYVFNTAEKKIAEIIAIGSSKKRAHYQTTPKPNQAHFTASAITIKYFPQDGLVFLIKQAQAEQAPNRFSGPLISYDVKNQVITSRPDQFAQTAISIQPNHLPKG